MVLKFVVRTILPLILLVGCVGPSPQMLTEEEDWMVVVATVRLPDYMDWYTRFAEHAWIDVKQGSEADWTRIEIGGPSSGVKVFPIDPDEARATHRWQNRVSILETLRGDRAREAIPRILERARAEPDFGQQHLEFDEEGGFSVTIDRPSSRSYDAFPGPNSNTLIAGIVEDVPGLHAELHHNSVGKDFPRGFRAGRTSSGFGVEVDSSYLGAGIGLRQGLELHLAQITLGVSLWPPALKLPFLPRIGIHQGWIGAAGTLEERAEEPPSSPEVAPIAD
ncbi:MAG: DUF3750 domain-containing protein [Planctomycetota bacterium]